MAAGVGQVDEDAAGFSVAESRIGYYRPEDRADAEAVTFDLLRHYVRDRWRELQALAPAVRTVSKISGQQVAERSP